MKFPSSFLAQPARNFNSADVISYPVMGAGFRDKHVITGF